MILSTLKVKANPFDEFSRKFPENHIKTALYILYGWCYTDTFVCLDQLGCRYVSSLIYIMPSRFLILPQLNCVEVQIVISVYAGENVFLNYSIRSLFPLQTRWDCSGGYLLFPLKNVCFLWKISRSWEIDSYQWDHVHTFLLQSSVAFSVAVTNPNVIQGNSQG